MSKAAPKIKCPKCGNHDLSKIVYFEKVPSEYRLLGFSPDGTLCIDAESNSTHYEYSDGGALECEVCGDQWSLPEKIDFVREDEYRDLKAAGAP